MAVIFQRESLTNYYCGIVRSGAFSAAAAAVVVMVVVGGGIRLIVTATTTDV